MERSRNPASDRMLVVGEGSARLPERLLLAHARGEVLFITGAGTSRQAGLPDFKGLVLDVYSTLDASLHLELEKALKAEVTATDWDPPKTLNTKQTAEGRRFLSGDFDVVLGMLERRIDGDASSEGKVRSAVIEAVTTIKAGSGKTAAKHAPIHSSLSKLANRGEATAIVTTNFDRLLQASMARLKPPIGTFSLGAIPRPGHRKDFSGVLHIHGAISRDAKRPADLILSDRDFGEHYLRRRTVPDFIYDAARLYHIVLVGYSANDAPMRYLLNAVAADGSRFSDLKERFAFVSVKSAGDPVLMEDWNGRGITPIPYSEDNYHAQLARSLESWSELSAINGSKAKLKSIISKIVAKRRLEVSEADRDLFDHFIRRANHAERLSIVETIRDIKAHVSWMVAIAAVVREPAAGISR